jgi:hypothetical protein
MSQEGGNLDDINVDLGSMNSPESILIMLIKVRCALCTIIKTQKEIIGGVDDTEWHSVSKQVVENESSGIDH